MKPLYERHIRITDLIYSRYEMKKLQTVIGTFVMDRINRLLFNVFFLASKKLLQLNLSDVLHLPVRFCHSVLPRLTSLQILNLRSTSCDDGALHIITNCCPLLK